MNTNMVLEEKKLTLTFFLPPPRKGHTWERVFKTRYLRDLCSGAPSLGDFGGDSGFAKNAAQSYLQHS
jgi:hypothetical protein